ncbi:hypothetical protein GCM10009677_46590 [Sphaerisporangium rubeum]|uniref:Histidine kinase/HSP90-like ATPase domain-containing protein n=1 Tax=Sphaerisporangium rubeum TaxID=321317 RepID=A0A7X0M7Y5_9ACTN|nr:ATP-binding protein [Sphaerisporangium rubeum]MBB6473509.1 hypothetical protein [Sphaerisporangium rubeum]
MTATPVAAPHHAGHRTFPAPATRVAASFPVSSVSRAAVRRDTFPFSTSPTDARHAGARPSPAAVPGDPATREPAAPHLNGATAPESTGGAACPRTPECLDPAPATTAEITPARERSSGSPRRDAQRTTASWVLDEDLASIPLARRLVRERLKDWGREEDGDVAELLLTELLTNALRHAGGAPVVTLIADGAVLRCEVRDSGPGRPRMHAAETYDESGRGMQLVDLLARRWGVTGHTTGKTVWFDLAAGPGTPAGT